MESLDLSGCRKFTDCKVCRIAEWNIPLFIQLHDLSLRQHYEYAALTTWTNTEIERSNAISPPAEQYQFLTKQQLALHLTKHVPLDDIRRSKVARAAADTAGQAPLDPVVARKLKDLTEHAAAMGVSDLDDFQRFHSTLSRMEKRFNDLDKEFDNRPLPDKDLILAYKAFGDSVARMLSDSIKMRQQERILHNAITSTLDTMSMGALHDILKNVDRAFSELRPMISQAEKADLIVSILRDSVASSMSAGVKTALDHLKSILKVA